MIGELQPLSPEEKQQRDAMLFRKKRGVQLVFAILVLISGVPLWFLQTEEHASTETLWQVTGVIMLLLGLGAFCLWRFLRKITMDLQSMEKLMVPSMVVRGWQINARRDAYLTINIGNRWVTLSADTIRRHMGQAYEMNRLYPGVPLMVELTPIGHFIMRIERV